MKICSKCKESKPGSMFHKNHKSPDGLQYKCKSCCLEDTKIWYANNRERAIQNSMRWRREHRKTANEIDSRYRQKHLCRLRARARHRYRQRTEKWLSILVGVFGKLACSRCGYDVSFVALDLHHKDRTVKTKGFNDFRKLAPTKSRIEEVKGCDLLCRNCHSLFHWDHEKFMEDI